MALLHDVPYFGLLRELSCTSCREYGERFTDPLLRSFFCDGEMSKMSALAALLLPRLDQREQRRLPHRRIAGHHSGHCPASSPPSAESSASTPRSSAFWSTRTSPPACSWRAAEILPADWVISAADGHETLYNLLNGNYLDDTLRDIYSSFETFLVFSRSRSASRSISASSLVSSSSFSTPRSRIDPGTELRQLALRFFHFDPTFTPAGKTAVTCFLPTRNFDYWIHLQANSPAAYQAEKDRIAQTVIDHLERRVPWSCGAGSLEVIDVSTPGHGNALYQ